MNHGTKVVKNGHPLESDVRWGRVIRFAAWGAGVAGVIVSALCLAGITRLFAMSQMLERIDERTLSAQVERAELADAIGDLKADVLSRQAIEDTIHRTFLTKEEFDRVMQPEIKPPRRVR